MVSWIDSGESGAKLVCFAQKGPEQAKWDLRAVCMLPSLRWEQQVLSHPGNELCRYGQEQKELPAGEPPREQTLQPDYLGPNSDSITY